MPDKQLTIATYATNASLAAITLVCVFAPTFFIDGESVRSSASSRKKGVVGLSNPANDCFINSVLQALAGLGDLRIYLIRETHRRKLDGPDVYAQLVEDPARIGLPAWKIEGLQRGLVTQGLKEVLDALNERPLYKKTISAAGFVAILEHAFRQRISRQQQDAQEFLQVVAERLCDEYHAGHRARNYARKSINSEKATSAEHTLDEKSVDRKLSQLALEDDQMSEDRVENTKTESMPSPKYIEKEWNGSAESQGDQKEKDSDYEDEDGFPLEGRFESQIECTTCSFKPTASESTFCSLTLNVPQVSSTTLNACFDGMFKTEYIDDFKCEKCRLAHALETFQQEVARSNSEKFKTFTQNAIEKLRVAMETDPEKAPKDVQLPDKKFAPKRKIARHIRITKFPKVIAIHLSRSIFDAGRSSLKNLAKVTFPERLPLGGLLEQRKYKLLSVVCHKGSHHSGHYESFRRQIVYPPFSTPNTFNTSSVYSKTPTPITSQISTPQVGAVQKLEDTSLDTNTLSSTPELLSPTSASSSTSLPFTNSQPSTDSLQNGNSQPLSTTISAAEGQPTPGLTSAPCDTETSSLRSVARSARETLSKVPSSLPRSPATSTPSSQPANNSKDGTRASMSDIVHGKRKREMSDRWWRISDEKIKESKTSEVLGMQKEVYLLFYELDKGDDSP